MSPADRGVDRGAGPGADHGVLIADPGWRTIELCSDVHLDANSPRTFETFRAHLANSEADAILILGDLFEVWIGDDAEAGDFESRCTRMMADAARKRAIGFMPGNRDFLVGDAWLARCSMFRLRDPTLLDAFGRRWLLTHGDALCIDDLEYQRFRALVRSDEWQREFLARPLADRTAMAREMRDASMRHQASRAVPSDVDPDAAQQLLDRFGVAAMIHGHTHRPGDRRLSGTGIRHVLPDWESEGFPVRGGVVRLSASGLERRDPTA